MDIQEAIKARHSVRKYLPRPIEADKVEILRGDIKACNAASGLHIQLVLDEPLAFSTGLFKYGAFSGVNNYLVMAAPKGKDWEEKVGWYGERLVLLAQMLGLNTCWVGLTYKKIPGAFTLAEGETVHCVISLGYGADQGVQHKQRPPEAFAEVQGEMPGWFRAGLEAALLAPTAVHQQRFKFILHEGNVVEARALPSFAGYTMVDLGIVKYHFEAVAGSENFSWKE